MAVSQADSHSMIVSGGHDGTVLVWDAATGAQVGDPLTGHTGRVLAVAVGQGVGGRTVIASGGGDDNTVRVWDATTGTPVGNPFTGHTGAVWSVAVGEFDGHTMIVSGGNRQDCADATTRQPQRDPTDRNTAVGDRRL